MPTKRDDTHQLIERELVVFKRPNTEVWYCRYKIEDTWFTVTTKERDLNKAKAAAQKILAKAQLRREENLPVVTKRFRDVAQLVLKAMEARIAAGHKVDSYTQYKRIIDKYLTPFFGSMVISNITSETIEDYEKWRAKEMGKTPMYSTVRKHNVVLNMIFKEAC